MPHADLILLHPPSIYRFRELPIYSGPVSAAIPSTSLFENYPIGFLTLSDYLGRHGISVRIVNLALKMLRHASFDPETFLADLRPAAFGIDLHWLPHVDGSLSLAEVIKRLHPAIPVIFGGLSATYFHREIMRDYPCVDFVLCGDSTEEPLHLLMETIMSGGDYGSVPNLVWRDGRGETIVNSSSWCPPNLDSLNFDYTHLLKMALKYRDPSGYLPFRNWLANPVVAVFSSRGCFHDCASCGGSVSSFARLCGRDRPAFRSAELLAEDIKNIAAYSGAPVMVINDLLQAGDTHADRFLQAMKQYRIENTIGLEFFHPPTPDFVKKVAGSLINFNVEISPESHDPRVRRAFGKAYDNAELEASIEAFMGSSCQRLDLFFMVGLPYQDYRSVMETVEYCGELLRRYGATKRIVPLLAPLAPFLDPGSRLFEEPERFGYRLLCRTLREHRQAMLMPTWKQNLNYETKWMTRDDIVRATYDGAMRLVELKTAHGLMDKGEAEHITRHILTAKDLMKRLEEAAVIDAALKEEIATLNRNDVLCGRYELKWRLRSWKLHPLNICKRFFT